MADSVSVFEIAKKDDPDALFEALSDGRHPSSIRDPNGATLVLFCVYSRLATNLAALLERFPDLSLHEAAAAGQQERVRELLDGGSDAVNTLSTDGWTPLHLAAFFGHPAIIEQLLAAGADPTIVSRAFERNRPIHAACAGRASTTEVVRLLAMASPDVDVRQEQGWTPLMIAAAEGRAEMVEQLLDAGANASLVNGPGKTAEAIARDKGHAAVADRIAARS